MTTENHSDAETSRETKKKSGTAGFIKEIGRDVGTDLLHETGTTIKWVVGGALIGAAVLGGLGFRGGWKKAAVARDCRKVHIMGTVAAAH